MIDNLTVRNHDVLLVVDVQNDFCPEGRLAVPRGHESRAANQIGSLPDSSMWC